MPGKDRPNWRRLHLEIAAARLDAVVAISPPNFLYVSGALIITQTLDPARQAAAVVSPAHAPLLVVHATEEALTRRDAWIPDVRTYVEGHRTAMGALAGVLTEVGLMRARIGIERAFLPVSSFEELRTLLPDAEWVGADHVFERTRVVKTAEEIEILRRAAIVTGEALQGAFARVRPGDTEKDLADELCCRLLRGGAHSTWLTLSSGEHLHVRHHLPGPRPLRPGDLALATGGGVFGGYYSNLGRMAAIGEPSDERRQRYRWLYQTLRETIGHVRPGCTVEALFRAAQDAYARAGYDYPSRTVGHSIGLSVHDWPLLRASDPMELEQGMTLQIEHGLPDGEGYRFAIEDLVLATDGGPRRLSDDIGWHELPVIG